MSLDREALARALGEAGLPEQALGAEHEHLFAAAAVLVAREDVERMAAVVRAVETAVRSPAFRERALARAPLIAREPPPNDSVFFGYDFHLADEGPQLIEINTNAGGALLNAPLARAQRLCCEEARERALPPTDIAGLERAVVDMFRREWRLARGEAPLGRIVIVDEDPPRQFLYPEFVLFRELFRREGIDAEIAGPGELALRDGALWHGGARVDLVYNRLTDFYLERPESTALRDAYASGAAVVTPHPHAHALYANKRNLVLLSDPELHARAGLPAEVARVLAGSVPRAVTVDPAQAEALWKERKRLFFKPAAGFGSKAAYRGDKVTRGVFAEILAGDYIAQRTVPPSERLVEVAGAPVPLKVDVRNFAYAGEVQLLAARLYVGQTTNFRTPGGGFAAVFTSEGR